MDKRTIYDIQHTIGYRFNHKGLLEQAFVRSSYANEHPVFLDNEKLEFYGDAALDYYVTRCMYEEFFVKTEDGRFKSAKNEKELTEIKSYYVDTDSLAHCIEITGLQNYLLMNDSDIKNNAKNQKSVMADLFEAIIGAVAVDSDWNYEKISNVCSNMLKLKKFDINYIKWVKNYCAEHGYQKPDLSSNKSIQLDITNNLLNRNSFHPVSQIPSSFSIYNEEQPFNELLFPKQTIMLNSVSPGEPIDGATLYIEELDLEVYSELHSRYEAYMDCAKKAYDKIQFLEMKKAIGVPDKNDAVNQLNVLYQKEFIHEPKYSFTEEHDKDGNPIWCCDCLLEESDNIFYGESSVKKEAKKEAAYKALCKLLDDSKENLSKDY